MTLRIAATALSAAALAAGAPAVAQDIEFDARSAAEQWGRFNASDGTFWLDSNDDVELIRYSSRRDVSLCLPTAEATGVGGAEEAYPLQISWDGQYTAVLRPGNCFFFDAKQVSVKPAESLPNGVVLTGHVNAESALQAGG